MDAAIIVSIFGTGCVICGLLLSISFKLTDIRDILKDK